MHKENKKDSMKHLKTNSENGYNMLPIAKKLY